jgi:mannose-6-phosphate isomerase-like protein (cupin superfamily)
VQQLVNDYIKGSLDDCQPYEVNGSFVRSILAFGEIPHVGCDHVLIPANTSLPPHLHQHCTSHLLITSGQGYAQIGEQHLNVKKGDIIYIPPGVPHSFSTASESMEFIAIQSPPILDDKGNADYISVS